MAKKYTVLLVEDDEMLLQMYTEKFTKSGYTVKSATNGENALEVLKDASPNIMLLDIVMPKMDGFQLLKNLRKDKKYAKVPIIMLTNLGQVEDIRQGEKLGANDYFVKANHTPAEVVAKVKEYLK